MPRNRCRPDVPCHILEFHRQASFRQTPKEDLLILGHQIACEAAALDGLSPLARGPAELALALARVLQSDTWAHLARRDRFWGIAVSRLSDFAGSALTVYADERRLAAPSRSKVLGTMAACDLLRNADRLSSMSQRELRLRLQVAITKVITEP